MDIKNLLTRCITVLYNEALLKETNSRELISEVLKKTLNRDHPSAFSINVIKNLRDVVVEMMGVPVEQFWEKKELLQRLQIVSEESERFQKAIEKGLYESSDSPELIQKSIASHRRSIERYLRELQVAEILSNAASTWSYQRDRIGDPAQFLNKLSEQLQKVSDFKSKKDPAIIDEVRLSNTDQLTQVLKGIYVSVTENRVYRTGFQGINRMLQGGIRPGEFWVQSALQYCYKTGLAQSILSQVALYNKPMLSVPGKTPAVVLYAFEDTFQERFKFILTQLEYTARRCMIEIKEYSTEEMGSIIKNRLSINGFDVLFFRINPTMWNYADLFNHVTELERGGYSIEFVVADYLDKLPKIGCTSSGAVGNDVLDLFSRVRMFFNAKGIAFWTPHQLSTEVKGLIRGSITEDRLVENLVGKGYYMGSRALDTIPDGILLMHKFLYGGDTYLNIHRDRHRYGGILEEQYKKIYLKFPNKMPIPDDINGPDSTLYKLPSFKGNAPDDLYKF